jgi:hypothetical protein
MEASMLRLLTATTLSALLLAPAGALAAQQTTGNQADLATSVKAKAPTHKRKQIIRSEVGGKTTTGAARSEHPFAR